MKRLLSVIVCFCLLFQVVGALGVLAEDITATDTVVSTDTTEGDGTETDTGDDITPDDIVPEQCGNDVWYTLQDGLLNITGTGPMWNWAGFDKSPWYYQQNRIFNITIAEGITEIGSGAFHDCINVSEVVIPESVTRIGSAAFQGCEGLLSVHIPAAVSVIEHDVFTACYRVEAYTVAEENTSFTSRSGCLYTKDGKTLRNYPLGSAAASFAIPDGTTTIGSFAFHEADNLLTVDFNDELVFIDDYAFTNIDNITQVDLPDSLKRTGGKVFGYCPKLEVINLPENMERIGAGMLDDTAYYCNLANWEDDVLYLDNYLLDTVYWPETLDYDDRIIKSGTLNVREGTTLIAEESVDSSNVTDVKFNDELQHIGFAAFYGLDLVEITLPGSLKTLGNRAFYDCKLLGQINMDTDIEYIGSDVFQGTAYDQESNYVNGILYYKNYLLDFDSTLPSDVVVRDGTTMIVSEAFWEENNNYGAKMKSITFPASLTTICDGAFYSCTNLTKVEVPSTVTNIGEKALGWRKWYDWDLEEEMYALQSNFTIQCEEGSAAEAYAIANGIACERPPIRATGMYIDRLGYSSLFSYIDDLGTYIFSVGFTPYGCVTEKVTWTSSDDSVATVDSRGYVTLRGVGNATITATSENGLTATHPISIVDIPHYTDDEPYTVDFDAEMNYRKCLFTPEEDGMYTLSLGDSSIRMTMYNHETGSRISDNYGYCEGELVAGVAYEITMRPANHTGVVTRTLTATKENGGGSAGEVVTPATIVGLTVTCTPDKMEYDLYEPFDNTGMVVELVYSDGSQQVFTNYFIDGYDSDTPGTKTLRVWFSEFVDTFDVTVNNTAYVDPDTPTTSLVIASPPNKVTYIQGEALNTTGMVVEIHWADGSESLVTGWTVSGYDPYYIGTQTLTVSWEGLTASLMVDVYAGQVDEDVPYLTGIALLVPPKKCVYFEGESLSVDGGKILAYYSNNQTKPIDLTAGMVTGYDSRKTGYQTLTVTYEGCETLYMIEVIHDYANATCTKASTCKVCKATTGKALGHKYSNACDTSCNLCKATRKVTHTYKSNVIPATLKKAGTITKTCSICGAAGSKTTIKAAKTVKLATTGYTYNGKVRKPAVVVKDSAGKTISSKYYTVTYPKGLKNVGTYRVSLRFKGNYSGSKTLTFQINPLGTTVRKLTAAKKSLKVTLTKKTTQVTGYEVQYATSKSFKSAKTKVVKSAKTTSLTIKGLKAKKTYYVRVRTFKTVSGKKYYSAWSTAKSKKTK